MLSPVQNERYQARMKRKKAIVDERIAKATEERGVLILLKGTGKGKSSSALGTMARSVGHGQKCGVIQFIKGKDTTGEFLFFKDHPMIDWHVMGHGFTWETQNHDEDTQAAEKAWAIAKDMLNNPEYGLIVFDELSYPLKYKNLAVERVVEALQARPEMQNVIITGRTMPDELIAIADTISDVRNERHAFKLGVKAQKGIEY